MTPAIKRLIRGDVKLLALWTEVTKRKPGEGQERDAISGQMMPNVDNVHERDERPTGNSAAAGLRKLQKAAGEGNEGAVTQLARRKTIYETLHPETAHGAAGNGRAQSRQFGDSTSDRFTAEAAKLTGRSERAVQRDCARGETSR